MASNHDRSPPSYGAVDRDEMIRFASERPTAFFDLLTGDAHETRGGMSSSFVMSEERNFVSLQIREDYLGSEYRAAGLVDYVRSMDACVRARKLTHRLLSDRL